jgi:PKD repeat protein
MTYTLNTNQLTATTLNNITLGSVTTSNGINGTYYTTGTVTSNPVMYIKQDPAELEVKGKLKLNGQDLEERLKTIEYVLGLPERDVTMESKYPSLKKKYDEYVNALAKYRTFDAIKGDDNE